MENKTICVTPDVNNTWIVRYPGTKLPVAANLTQREAIEIASRISMKKYYRSKTS